MTLQNPINVHFRPMEEILLEQWCRHTILAKDRLERTCRTWAVSGDLGLELMQNITGEGTRHARILLSYTVEPPILGFLTMMTMAETL